MAYFVTGGAGFIGHFLVANLLKRGDPVYVFVRKSSHKEGGTQLSPEQMAFAQLRQGIHW